MMRKIEDALFYFVTGSKTFCNNAKDEDIVCVKLNPTSDVDRLDGQDIFYWSLDFFRKVIAFKCPDERVDYKQLYNIVFAIRKERGEIVGDLPEDIANYNFFDYKDDIIRCCVQQCEKFALYKRYRNPNNKDACLKNSYWIFANYFALVNNSLDFTQEQLDIIQKCHDNELPRSYAEDVYQKLLAMLPQSERQVEQPTISYDELVDSKIREKYSVSQEFAILRQRDTKPTEFAEYNAYCEQCKAEARAEIAKA